MSTDDTSQPDDDVAGEDDEVDTGSVSDRVEGTGSVSGVVEGTGGISGGVEGSGSASGLEGG